MVAEKTLTGAGLGGRLRDWRSRHAMTLAAVSAKTGVASSSLSKIENEQVSVSYHTLKRICDGLGIPIEEIINPGHKSFAPGRRAVTRAGQGAEFRCRQYVYEAHATELSKKDMIPLHMRVVARHRDDFEDWNRHDGEEFIYILKGEIEVHTEFYAPVTLKQGDSLYFDSSMGHCYISTSEEDAEILSICYDPNVHHQQNIDEFFRAGRLGAVRGED